MFGEGEVESCKVCGLFGESSEGSSECEAGSFVTVGTDAWPVSDTIAGGFGAGAVTGVAGFLGNGWLTMLVWSWGGAGLGCSGTGLVSSIGCGVETGDCARVRSCTVVPMFCKASGFK
jgi:hypothetical protein